MKETSFTPFSQSIAEKIIPPTKGLVIFDSYCVLCNRVIQFLSKIDKHEKLLFTSFESKTWKSLQIPLPENTDSVVFITRNTYYLRSEAVIEIAKTLPFPFRIISIYRLLPKSLRNSIYNFIARNRFRLFGESQACKLITGKSKRAYLS